MFDVFRFLKRRGRLERRTGKPRRNALGHHRGLALEPLESRHLLSIGVMPHVAGMHLVESSLDNLRGQVVYLDCDGAKGVDYKGPVTVPNLDVPAFKVSDSLAGKENAVIGEVLANVRIAFAGSGVTFTLDRPTVGTAFSTVYLGGTDDVFRQYGSFLGLAEDVDVGNRNHSDNAFVFSDELPGVTSADAYAQALAEIIEHETGHLLGYEHDNEVADTGVLASVALSAPMATAPGTATDTGYTVANLTPTLQWTGVTGADYYAVAISRYPYGSNNIIYNPQQVYGTSITIPAGFLQAGTKYRWNMQAHNSAGQWSSVSNTLYFQTQATVSGPANNNFASRALISGPSATVAGTNVGASKETGEPSHAGNSGGKSVWWTWTAPSSGSVQIDTIGSNFDTIMGVYTGSSVSSLTTVAGDDDSGGSLTSKVTFNAVSGTTYQIAVDGYGGASGNITLHVNLATTATPQPPTNVAATDGSYTDKVRVTWTASANATGYEVWRNTSNNSGTAAKISFSDVMGTSYDDTTATAGTTYWYWVKAKNASGTSGFSAADSGYRVTTSGPVNNNFASRALISGPSATVAGTNVGASKETGEPSHAGNSGGKSVWWTWTAPSSGSVQIDTIGSNFDTIMGVYTGSSVSSLTTVAGDDDSGGSLTSRVTFNAVSGTTYQIAVDGYGGASGNITLHVNLTTIATPQPPTNVAATDGSYTDKVRVTWTASANATGYEVWRNTSNNSGSATKITGTDVTGTSFDDTTATAGTTYWYWIKAKNASGTSGFSAADAGYRVTVSGPANNNFASRALISGTSAMVTGTNVGAGKETGEPSHAGNSGGKSVWWTWTAPSSGSVQFDTIGSSFDTIMGVYTGSNVSSLTTVASDDDSGGSLTSKVTFNAVSGTTYQIAVDGYGGASGNITLHVSLTAGDQYEPDNTPTQATLISIDGSAQTHSIGPANDIDWVKFTLTQTSPVVIETRGVSGGDTRMWLFGPNSSTTQIAYDDDGGIDYYSRIVSAGLGAGTYFVKVDEYGNNNVIPQYTISVTALQPADVFLTRSDGDLISTFTRTAESSELGVPYSTTYSHAAMYVGSGLVDEMLLSGYREVGLTAWYSEHEYVDIYRNTHIGNLGPLVAAVARSYSGTPYAPYEIEVLGVTALSPAVVGPIIRSQAYVSYLAQDVGTQRMICSELVARAFAEVGNVVTLDVTLWPTLDLMGDLSDNFRWDFTTPTVLSRSPDLRWLNT